MRKYENGMSSFAYAHHHVKDFTYKTLDQACLMC